MQMVWGIYRVALLASVLMLTVVGPAQAQQQDFSQVAIGTEPVAEGLYMLTGFGGNIGVSAGPDGVILIDDQFADLVDKIRGAVAEISPQEIRLVLNTHWHFDHTGGNELLGRGGALIIAHENVRKRMSSEQFTEFFQQTTPASPSIALPVVTFTRDVTLHLNGQTIEVQYVPPAHTDGDAIVWFKELNAVHLGDTYFNGFYPFIDFSTGGSIRGMIGAANMALARIDDDTKVIPGHGPLSNRSELRDFRDMLRTVSDRIEADIRAGKSLEEVVAGKPTAKFDAEWGDGFIQPDDWVRLLYKGMSAP
jgi:glyoxylase-like metal-dependent hydrolase (beta-lactamase superfamily II)